MNKNMKIENLDFGVVIARLPRKTLVRSTSPPHKYFTIKGGFLDSEIPKGEKIVRFDLSEVEDGTAMAYLDKNPDFFKEETEGKKP
jgi:hypothetical protein